MKPIIIGHMLTHNHPSIYSLISSALLSLSFSSHADWHWSTNTENIGQPSGIFYYTAPQIKMDSTTGRAVATWIYGYSNYFYDYPLRGLKSAVFDKKSWKSIKVLSDGVPGPLERQKPSLALSKNANATVMVSIGSLPTLKSPVPQFNVNKNTGLARQKRLLQAGEQEDKSRLQVTIAKDNAGAVMAVWPEKLSEEEYILKSSIFRNNKWSKPYTLTKTTYDPEQKVVSTKNNDFTVVWIQSDAHNNGYIQTARYRQASWSPVQNITQSGEGMDTRVALAVDGKGTITAVWANSRALASTDPEGTLVFSAQRTSNGLWDTPSKVGFAGRTGTYPSIASNSKGMITIAWAAEGEVVKIIHYDGQVWGETVSLGDTQNIVPRPEVAIDDNGNATVLWSVLKITEDSDWTKWLWSTQATRYSGNTWSSPIQLCSQCINANIAGDSKGNVLAIWASMDGLIQSKRGSYTP